MATIDSVDLYLSRSASADPGDAFITVEIYNTAAYTTRPNYGVSLGSKTLDITNFPITGSQDFVTFTFDTPISISNNGFYGIYIYGSGIAYDLAGTRFYKGATDWADASDGEPIAGDERFWRRTISSGTWSQTGDTCCYSVNCTGCDDNSSATPDATYYGASSGFGFYCYGIRTYLEGATPPEKPINPTPLHEASDVTLDQTAVTWEDGGGATSYDVYKGTLSGFLELVESGVTDTSYILRSTNWPQYGEAYYWRIDAVNSSGTTAGDEWYFTTLIFAPPTPSGITWTDPGNDSGYTGTPLGTNNMLTVRRLVGAADNCLWIET
uniref:Fibronectin type-III domain-containing protein n=1 Tax=viral metagenome TaxID=1070528 RepID=A0A6M3IZT4_9ZZZZ